IHPDGNSPALTGGTYWPGWDIARGMAVYGDGSGGYQMDGYGGVHNLGGAPASGDYARWGFDIARAIAVDPTATSGTPKGGWTLDGYGGVHPFGGEPGVGPTAYWPGFDIARGLGVLTTTPTVQGYTLDAHGGTLPVG